MCDGGFIDCQQTGRNAYVMKLDPPYCDVIVQRWGQFIGRKAKRLLLGEQRAPAEAMA